MSIMKMTMIGIESYLNENNKSVFDKMVIPESELIDRDTLINSILMQCGEFEVLYANPDFLTNAIGVWSMKNMKTFEKWVNALSIEYNPLENYDRIEEWTDNSNSNGHSVQNGMNTDVGNQTTNDSISAFDSDTMRPNTASSTDTDNTTRINSVADSNDNASNVHSGRMHGNIGVTTSQQMLQSELDISLWNIYTHIATLFQQEFTIPIY